MNAIGYLVSKGNGVPARTDYKKGEVIYGELGQCFSKSGKFVIVSVQYPTLECVEVGGTNRKRSVDARYVRPISKKFGIGFYYEDVDMPQLLSDKEIEGWKYWANEKEKQELLKKELEEKQYRQDQENLLKEYPFLLNRIGGKWLTCADIAKNMRMYLKHHLPGVKVSVRKDGADCLRIEVKDKQHLEEVRKFSSIFKSGSFDLMNDYMVHKPTVFIDTFGGIDYIFVD